MQNCYHQKRGFWLKMYHKTFGGRPLPGPPGGAYSAPTDPLATLRVWGPLKEMGRMKHEGEEQKGEERERQ